MEFATPELLKEAQMSYGGRENLVDAYIAASGETVDWFADELGVEFEGRTGDAFTFGHLAGEKMAEAVIG